MKFYSSDKESESFMQLLWSVGFVLCLSLTIFFTCQSVLANFQEQNSSVTLRDTSVEDKWDFVHPIRVTTAQPEQLEKELSLNSSIADGPQVTQAHEDQVLPDFSPEPELVQEQEIVVESVYQVKEDDVLSQIALDVYGSIKHTDYLKKINDLNDSDFLQVGQILRTPSLPQAKQSNAIESKSTPDGFFDYTVAKNESPWDIAEKFYGNGYLYTRLIEDNPNQFKSGEDFLKEAVVLRIRKN